MNLIPRSSFFDDMFDFNTDFKEGSLMKTDIYKKDGSCVVEMDLPGVKKEDITMDLDHGYLTISAKKEETTEEKGDYIRKERFYGETKRTFYVGEIDENQVKATYENGTLVVTFPDQRPASTKKQITID